MKLTKKECEEALNQIEESYYNSDNSFGAMNQFKRNIETLYKLINEHFVSLNCQEGKIKEEIEYKYIYIGSFYFDISNEKISLKKGREKYKSDKFNQYIVDKYLPISSTYSVIVLDGYLNKPLQIGDNLTLFYSVDEEEVDRWLQCQRMDFENTIKKMIKMMDKLKVEEEYES